jgi:biopolymer transport protein ExbD
MKFKRHMKLEQGLRQIDIAPMIDMVFLLLIFFMLTSSFVMQPGIAVNLPKALTSEVVKAQSIEVLVSSDNIIYVDGKILAISALKQLMAQAAPRNQPVLIKSDRKATMGRVVEIWDICRDKGIAQVSIATDQ